MYALSPSTRTSSFLLHMSCPSCDGISMVIRMSSVLLVDHVGMICLERRDGHRRRHRQSCGGGIHHVRTQRLHSACAGEALIHPLRQRPVHRGLAYTATLSSTGLTRV